MISFSSSSWQTLQERMSCALRFCTFSYSWFWHRHTAYCLYFTSDAVHTNSSAFAQCSSPSLPSCSGCTRVQSYSKAIGHGRRSKRRCMKQLTGRRTSTGLANHSTRQVDNPTRSARISKNNCDSVGTLLRCGKFTMDKTLWTGFLPSTTWTFLTRINSVTPVLGAARMRRIVRRAANN